jgi:hypothetical protein
MKTYRWKATHKNGTIVRADTLSLLAAIVDADDVTVEDWTVEDLVGPSIWYLGKNSSHCIIVKVEDNDIRAIEDRRGPAKDLGGAQIVMNGQLRVRDSSGAWRSKA